MKFTIGLDFDEVLMPCITLAAERLGIDPAKIIDWNLEKCSELTEAEKFSILGMMISESFIASQQPYEGAKEMIEELTKRGHTLIIASSVSPELMGVRSESILKFFPDIEPRNIMLGARKELLHLDFLLDDSPYNLENCKARYPVLFTRDYNKSVKGYLRVNNYSEFLELVEALETADSPNGIPDVKTHGHPGIVCLVGPSGSGKSFISDELVKKPIFSKVRAITTREPREGEENGVEYFFVSQEQFDKAVEGKKLVEHTEYSGANYGISFKEIESIWAQGKIAVKPVDINGAQAIKSKYPDRTLTLFVRRDKESLIKAILDRGCPSEDKSARIISIDSEYENEKLCDATVFNNGTLNHAVDQVMRLL